MDTRGDNSRYESRTVRPTVRLASARPRLPQQPPPREPQQTPHFRQAPSPSGHPNRPRTQMGNNRRSHDSAARHHADDLGRAQRTYTPASGRRLTSNLGARPSGPANRSAGRPQRNTARPVREGQRSTRDLPRQTRGAGRPARRGYEPSSPRSQGSVIGQPLRRGAYSNSHMYFASRRPGMRGARRGAMAIDGPLRIRRGLLAALIVLFGIIGALFGAVSAGIEPAVEVAQLDMPLLSPADLPLSTPKKSWKKGTMPYLYQTDPMWAQSPYGGGTVRDNACGPTAFTMVYIYFTGNTDYTPATMAAWADDHDYAPSGATEWSFMSDGAAAFGISSKMIDTDKDQITSALSQGKPVIALMNVGDFTTVGHFIVLSDIDSNGNVTAHDPASAWRSSHSWPIDTIVDQSTYSWVFSL